ncbi:MAG: TonB-dependent receptor [Rikenellaceae bacterium]
MVTKQLFLNPLLLLTLLLSLCVTNGYAQGNSVSGVVRDDAGYALPGVVVQIVGNATYGVVSGVDGEFTVQLGAATNPELTFTYVGMVTQTVAVETKSNLQIVLENDSTSIEEVVVVGFGEQKRVSITGAVTSVKTEDLPSTASSSLATSLTGRMPGTVIVQNSGEAGASASDISIRGSSNAPLILVDGIERDFEDLDMDEVESISVLKDASATAVYGIRGGDGVIIVTTKRGREGKFKINFKSEVSLSQIGNTVEPLNAAEFSLLRNEGLRNDSGISLTAAASDTGLVEGTSYTDFYTPGELSLYESGSSNLYPNTDWYDVLYNEFGHRERYSVSISGGNKFFTTYTSLSYMNERDCYADYDTEYDSRSRYDRYNIRTNLDFTLSKTSKLSVDVGGQFGTRTRTNGVDNMSALAATALTASPMGAYFDGDSIIGALAPVTATVYDTMSHSGYRKNHTNKLQMSAKFNQDLSFITKGLSFEVSVSYDHSYNNNFTQKEASSLASYYGFFDRENNIAYNIFNNNLTVDPYTGWAYNPITEEWVENADVLTNGFNSVMTGSATTSTGVMNFNTKARLGYNRSFAKHNVAAMAVFTTNSQSYHSDDYSYVPIRYVEAAARLSYNYDYRYFVEFNGGYNGSETFYEDNRFGFFPAFSAGWVPSNENWFPENNVMTFLKLRGSYGETGIDSGINRFTYFDEYDISYGGQYLFGSTSLGGQGEAMQITAGNRDLQWATNYQKNIGIETKWFNDKLSINADIYRNDKRGTLLVPNYIPAIYAGEVSLGNIGEIRYEGYEVEASWQGNFNNFKYRLFANYNKANAININIDEVTPEYDWQVLTGRHPKQQMGLYCIGFYSQDDINKLMYNSWEGTPDNPSSTYSVVQAGDLKYKDLNEDGKIDTDDMMYFENTSTPKTTYGFGGSFSYKKWDMSLFFQGAADVTYTYSGNIRMPFVSSVNNGASYVMGRWTQERYDAGEEITFPRMSGSASTSDHNYQNSNFWMHDASYVRLKSASVSYNLVHQKLEKIGISKINVSLSGTNLLTFTSLEIVDPETTSGTSAYVPPSRVFTCGVNVSF